MTARKLKLEKVGEKQYRFHYPKFVTKLDDLIFDASDLIDIEEYVEAKNILHRIVDIFPEHIDAHHHLAICLHHQGEIQVAFNVWEKAVNIGLRCFPEDVPITEMFLEWGWLENRPFLRAYEALGLAYYEKGRIDEALSIFNNMLHMNPIDNQGIRALAIKANFDLKHPEDVIKVCDRFPEDPLAETFYGRLLALFQLKNKDQIEHTLKEAIQFLPLIAKEIVKTKHSDLDDLFDEEEFDEEKVEALEYWENFGKYWQETKGAIKFLQEGLSKYQRGRV